MGPLVQYPHCGMRNRLHIRALMKQVFHSQSLQIEKVQMVDVESSSFRKGSSRQDSKVPTVSRVD